MPRVSPRDRVRGEGTAAPLMLAAQHFSPITFSLDTGGFTAVPGPRPETKDDGREQRKSAVVSGRKELQDGRRRKEGDEGVKSRGGFYAVAS